MSEENLSTDVQASLDSLEHYYLENHLSRTQDYNVIYKALEKNDHISSDEIQRLLAVCVLDLKEDNTQYAASIMNIIPAILSRVQMGTYDAQLDLLPSALGVIQLLKTIALLNEEESLKVTCFDTLLSYPNDTLIAAAEHDEEVIEVFNLYCQTVIPVEIRLQACSVLHKLLKILPPEKKRVFVEKGITVWFSKIIPIIMNHVSMVSTNSDAPIEKIEENVEILEFLTDELVACDYSKNEMWHSVLESICEPEKYTAVMKNLLQNGSGNWHRLWIVFIRLLKNQVALLLGSLENPTNSMLPVVEAAFKMDMHNKCKAFACWNVLIDSFSTETNESNITKGIKLLITPLKANNAKTETTALPKFKCWWNFITKFQNKMDKSLDSILVSFLNFCFGRHDAIDKPAVIPGKMSVEIKKLCIQAIVDMVGHDNCEGCTDLPKLKGKLINTKMLVENWNDWVFSLSSTIMMSANTDHGLTEQQMKCLWKSFLMTIGELPENNIRKDLFSETLSILLRIVQECISNSKLADIVFNALILSLFEGDIRIKQLLKTKNAVNDPLHKIAMTLLDPSLKLVYQSSNFRELVTKLKPVTNMVLNPVFSSPNGVIDYILKAFPENDTALIVWTSLVESICESNYDVRPQILCDIMMWPLETINSFTCDIKISAMVWYTANDTLYPKLMKTEGFDTALSKFLYTAEQSTYSSVYFKLCATLSVIKHKLTEESYTECEKEIKLLQILSNHIDSYESFAPLFPIFIDRILAVISILITNVNENVTFNILICVRIMVTVMTQACDHLTDVSQILTLVASLLKSIDSLFKVESYHKHHTFLLNDLIVCTPFLSKQSLTKSVVHSVMITFSKITKVISTLTKIKTIIDEIEEDSIDLEKNQSSDDNEFPTPKTKVQKRKFNLSKLIENQTEKLQTEREDIPALYQDLSQSQDEFKLVSCKTDSQDTSNSSKSESKSSKPGNNETASDMLLNLASCSQVVPNILENVFTEIRKESPTVNVKDSLSIDNNVNKIGPATSSNSKSPRVLSAPPLLSADRPSRIKRKPQKYDEYKLLLTAKKSRRSTQDIDNDKSEQSKLVTTPLKTNQDKGVIVVEDVDFEIVFECEGEKVNEPVELQGPENQNISGVNEIIQSPESSQKDVTNINNATDIITETQNIEVVLIEEPPICIDLDISISSDTDKNNENSNDIQVESFNNIKDEGSLNKKGKKKGRKSNDIQDKKSNIKKARTSIDNKNEKLIVCDIRNMPEGQGLETPLHPRRKRRWTPSDTARPAPTPAAPSPSPESIAVPSPAMFMECEDSYTEPASTSPVLPPPSAPRHSRRILRDNDNVDVFYGSDPGSDQSDEETVSTAIPRVLQTAMETPFDDEDEEDVDAVPEPDVPPTATDQPWRWYDFEWKNFPNSPMSPASRREKFSQNNVGPTTPRDDPIDIFLDIWDRPIMEYIASETNKYAQQVVVEMMANNNLRPSSRISRWVDTTADELYMLFALIMAMGVLTKSRMREYWATTPDIFYTPAFRAYMSIDRFMLLSKCLHFNDNNGMCELDLDASEARLFKIQPILSHLNKKFQSMYTPSQNIALDESLLMWKGCLDINQLIPNKTARQGIKTYEICESQTGYLWRFEVHAHKKSPPQQLKDPLEASTPSIVLRMTQGLEHKGYTLWMDNFYNSPCLARRLKCLGFDCVGTLRTDRKFVPKALHYLTKQNMRRGQIAGRTSGDVDVMVWRDNNRVGMISTYHGNTVQTIEGSTKPTLIMDYNIMMGGVDKKDQLLAMYPIERKRTQVWYKKFFRRLLNVSVLNSYIIHRHSSSPSLTHRNFRMTLVRTLLTKYHPAAIILQPTRLEPRPVQFDARLHRIEEYPMDRNSANPHRLRRRCTCCSRRMATFCVGCAKPVCMVNCFLLLHS